MNRLDISTQKQISGGAFWGIIKFDKRTMKTVAVYRFSSSKSAWDWYHANVNNGPVSDQYGYMTPQYITWMD